MNTFAPPTGSTFLEAYWWNMRTREAQKRMREAREEITNKITQNG